MIVSKDALWKGVIEDFFEPFLYFFYPQWIHEVDFDKEFEFLDKELDQLFPETENIRRYADKLVKVFTKEGEEKWVLVHIEVQGYYDKHFAERMFTYYYRIYDRYRKEIMALAIFTDNSSTFQPSEFNLTFLNTKLKYQFDTYKLYTKKVNDFYKQKDNPFSIIMETAWCELHNKGSIDELHNKTEIARKLFNKGFDKRAIEKLLNFLRYYFRLQDSKKERIFESRLDNFTSLSNTIITMGLEEAILADVKRQGVEQGVEQGIEQGIEKGIKQGIEEGIEQGKKELIKQLLQKEFSVKKIHEMVELPLDFIIQVQKELED